MRSGAAEALGKIGPQAVEPLIRKLNDENEQIRYWAIYPLSAVEAQAEPAVEPLAR